MANFSENQVRHLYVVKSAADFTVGGTAKAMHFNLKDVNGDPVRSDIIENIISAKAVGAASMARKTKVVKVTMDANVNGGAPIAGEDYIVRIEYRQFIAKSDETFYHEFGSAHATSASTASSLLLDLAKNLKANTKKQEMVKITLDTATTGEVEVDAYVAGTDGAVEGIFIKEIPQDWVLGIKEQTPVLFEVATGMVVYNGDELPWGVVAVGAQDSQSQDVSETIGNGKIIADLEYFLMGERGDQYRMIGWPNYVRTGYMVDPTKTYDVIDIHYAYVGANHSVQKSEKTITLVADSATSHAIMNTATTGVIAKINAVIPTEHQLSNIQ